MDDKDIDINNLNLDELRELEQSETAVNPFALLMARYYRDLINNGVPPEHAIILVNNYQAIYVSRYFDLARQPAENANGAG